MPCRDWLDEETNAADERIKHLKYDMGKIRGKMDSLARLLCEAGGIIKDANLTGKMSNELKHWMWAHNRADRKNK